jgi:selenocysteine-specific elongation factor
MTSVVDVRLSRGESGPGLASPITLHIGAARAVARVRMLGCDLARLSLDHPLPLHIGDLVLLRDPGAAAGRPITGATVLDVLPPRLRGNGAAAAAQRELASWPQPPAAADVLRRHRLLRAGAASAMGLRDLPAPVAGDWLADPAHWERLRQRLAEAVAAHAARDPLSPGLAADAARAELGLPDRGLVMALCAQGENADPAASVFAVGGYLRPGSDGRRDGAGAAPQTAGQPAAGPAGPAGAGHRADPALPAAVAAAVQAVLDSLAQAPFNAPDANRLRELGLEPRAAAAAERAGLLRRLPGNVVLAADAVQQAERILALLPQPFTAAQARLALETSRRVVIPLLELLDREGVTRRLPDDRRIMRDLQ